VECIDVKNRIQRQDKPVLITMPPEEKYRKWTFDAYPLHNIWDALALFYTLTVGEVVDEREGELYLAQLKYIAKALTATGYIARSACPAIVGAIWRVSEEIPLRVSFAFSCLGGKQAKIRDEENASRRRYCDFLYSISNTIKNTSLEKHLDPERCPNEAGNCAEFLNWPTVRRDAGVYRTLCLKIPKEETIGCCAHCKKTAEAAKSKGMTVEDVFNKSSLVEPNCNSVTSSYITCEIKGMEKIIGEGEDVNTENESLYR